MKGRTPRKTRPTFQDPRPNPNPSAKICEWEVWGQRPPMRDTSLLSYERGGEANVLTKLLARERRDHGGLLPE